MTLFQAAYEINERIQKEQSFKKYMSENRKILYLEFKEHDLPSVTFAFDKSTYMKIRKLIFFTSAQ
jgi:hypothetical protein